MWLNYVYAAVIVAAITGALWYSNHQYDSGYDQGYADRATEQKEATMELEDRLRQAKGKSMEAALELQRKEALLSRAEQQTQEQVVKYVTKEQKSDSNNLTRGAAWLLSASAKGCACTDVRRCSGISDEKATAPGTVTTVDAVQWCAKTASYAAYAVRRYNALVDAVRRAEKATTAGLPLRRLAMQ